MAKFDLVKRKKEKKEFWNGVIRVSKIVDKWPDWKKGGINVEQPGIVKEIMVDI